MFNKSQSQYSPNLATSGLPHASTSLALAQPSSVVEQQNVCKYAFFMAKWKHKIYKKFVRDLHSKDHLLRLEH